LTVLTFFWEAGRGRLPGLETQKERIKMKFKAALLASFLLTCTFSVQAADVTMVPSIGYGQSHLNFDRSTGVSDVSQFNIIDLGMTASYGRYYVKLSSEMPLGEEYTYGPALVRQFKREDFGVTAGD